MNGQARQGCAPNGGDMRYCRTNSHRPLTNAYSAARFGTAYRTNGSLTLRDGCACGHSRRLLATRATGRQNRPRCAPARTPRGQGCRGPPHWPHLDPPQRSPRPRPDQAGRSRGRPGTKKRPPSARSRPRVRGRRHDRAPEAASGACQRLLAARRTSPGQLATRPRSSAVQLACPLVTLAGSVGGTQRATKPLADSRSMRLYPHRHYPGQSARRPGPAGCARYAPGQDAPERVCAGQGRTGQKPPEP